MRRRVVRAKVIDRAGEAVAEQRRPHPVDDHPVQELGLQHECRQRLAAVAVFDEPRRRHFAAVDEPRRGGFGPSVPSGIKDDRVLRVAGLTGEVLIDQLGVIDVHLVSVEPTQPAGLAEERIELPERLLLPLVERVVVTLGALDLLPQKDPGRAAGRQRRVLVVDLADQKVHRTVEPVGPRLGGPGGGDQLMDQFVVRFVPGHRVPEVFQHAVAVGQVASVAPAGTTDQQVRPIRRPVLGVFGGVPRIVQQRLDQPLAFVIRAVDLERGQFLDSRDASDQVEVHPAAPHRIVDLVGRFDLVIVPGLFDRGVDPRNNLRVLGRQRGGGQGGGGRENEREETHQTKEKRRATVERPSPSIVPAGGAAPRRCEPWRSWEVWEEGE